MTTTDHSMPVATPAHDTAPAIAFRAIDVVADAALVCRLSNASNQANGLDWVGTPEETAADLATPVGFDPAHDVVLATLDGEPVGVAWVRFVERDGAPSFELQCAVAPEARRRGVGRALLRWQERRAHERAAADRLSRPVWVGTWRPDASPGVAALLDQEGYRPVRFFFEMIRPSLDDLPGVALPDGIEIRPVEATQHRRIFDADGEAFQDHWGARPATDELFRSLYSAPDLDTRLWRVAWDGDEIAGVVMSYVYPAENAALGMARGWLERVSVRRPWRRRGLASALMVAAMESLRERGLTSAGLGVDADNVSGALAVYERLGFQVEKRSTVVRKPLVTEPAPAA